MNGPAATQGAGSAGGRTAVQAAVQAALARGDLAEVERLLGDFLAQAPGDYELRCLHGYALQLQGRLAEAEAAYAEALRTAPPSPQLYHNMGVLQARQGKREAAEQWLRRALALQPDALATLAELAAVLQKRDLPAALECYERILALDPAYVAAHVGMGNAFADAGWEEDAARSFETALALAPDHAEALNGLAVVRKHLGQYDAALALSDRALAQSPDDPALLRNRAMLLDVLGRHAEAEAICDRLLARDPEDAEAHFSLGCLYLLTGRLREGWREYEYRWHDQQRPEAVRTPTTPLPRWSGEAVEREASGLIVYTEQGFGDALQFARYLPLAAARFGRVMLQTRPPLLALLRRSFGHCAEVVATVPETPPPGYTHHCLLLSLPAAFATSLETIPATVPYLQPDAAKVEAWRRRLADEPRLRVGIAWATGKQARNKRSFELSPARLEPLWRGAAGVAWYSLNKTPLDDGQRAVLERCGVVDWSDELADFDDTAALIEALDLVVSVDTAVAHLGGGLGRPVWLLNRYESEWRWLLGREDSPWYPTLRLFRQQRALDWSAPLQAVAAALAGRTRTA